MTPAARVAAAIDILDRNLAGEAAEKILTTWGRANRYAGSGDRAAIRDLVFSALRCRRSFGYLGRGDTGRALMIGWAHATGADLKVLFSGEKYAPDSYSDAEMQVPDIADADRGVRLDCPDWLLDRFDTSFGVKADAGADAVLTCLKSRAPLFLRLNSAKTDREAVIAMLAETEILAIAHPLSDTALEVTQNPRRVAQSTVYKDGLVEFQDAASQAVVDFLPLADGIKVLDYCAGGGGKGLAMAAQAKISLTAHDADENRMKDLPNRAARAGVTVAIADAAQLHGQVFDLVLCDAPCSGSGAWRRAPDAKWALTSDRLQELVEIQHSILNSAKHYVSASGMLAYVTCSVFENENADQIEVFLSENHDWRLLQSHGLSPLEGGDGFFVAILKREDIR